VARSTVGSISDTLNKLVTNANCTITTLQSTASNLVDGDVAQLAMEEQKAPSRSGRWFNSAPASARCRCLMFSPDHACRAVVLLMQPLLFY
jgi:hypothetical protein